MTRYAWSVGRVALWALAMVLASFACKGLLDLAPATGSPGTLFLFGSMFVFGFVGACVITAGELIFPAMRRGKRLSHGRTLRHP
jgi:hypothetical protein